MHHFTTISLTIAASLLGLTSALPTQERRSCQYTYPTSMYQLTPIGNTAEPVSTDFCISTSTRVQYAHFANIPATAQGACQLEFTFTAGYDVAGAGSHQVNVWKTAKPVAAADTWDTAPKPTTLFGTVTLNSDPKSAKTIVVNSGACAGMRDFEFTVAENGNGVGGTVVYQQRNPEKNATIAAAAVGMRISYGC
jgi:hypothetical protein